MGVSENLLQFPPIIYPWCRIEKKSFKKNFCYILKSYIYKRFPFLTIKQDNFVNFNSVCYKKRVLKFFQKINVPKMSALGRKQTFMMKILVWA